MEMRGSKIAIRNRETIGMYLANGKEKIRKVCGGGSDQRGEYHSGHPPPFCRGLSLQPNFQKGGVDRTSTLEEGCWERGSDFFQWGGCNFHIKNKLKSEIFNDKKSL